MISKETKNQIISIWNKYIIDKKTKDTKGNEMVNIDEKRIESIETIKIIIDDFLQGRIDLSEFKTDIDSYNKQNNLWGFTAIKGQMFFNLLVRNNETEELLKSLTNILRGTISEPNNLAEALEKIKSLDSFCQNIFLKAKDRRKAPNPSSVGYFLSYFWQIFNYQKWPIMYSSIIISLNDLGLWKEHAKQNDA